MQKKGREAGMKMGAKDEVFSFPDVKFDGGGGRPRHDTGNQGRDIGWGNKLRSPQWKLGKYTVPALWINVENIVRSLQCLF